MSVVHLKAHEVGAVPPGATFSGQWKPDWRGGSYADEHGIRYRVRPSDEHPGRYVLVWELSHGTRTLTTVDFPDIASAQRFAAGARLVLPP